MPIYHICFSPTGGTKKAGALVLSAFEKPVIFVDLLQKEEEKWTFQKEDLCFFSIPSYGGRVPLYVKNRLSQMRGSATKAVLVCSFGNRAIDDTLLELHDLVSSLGFHTVAAVEAVTEHSLVPVFGKGRPDEEDAKILSAFSLKIREKIESGREHLPDLPGNRPYKERKQSPMNVQVEDTCNKCFLCADHCPVGAISKEDVRILDASKCFSCMHCVAVCPKKARHYDKKAIKELEERLESRCSQKKENKIYL